MQYDARNEQSLSWTFTCQPKTVKSVAVSGLNVPMDGSKPDFTANTDSDYYTVDSIEWMDYTNGTDMTADDTFVEGNEYWLLLTVVPAEEDGNKLCEFVANNKTVAYLNGVEVKNIPNDSWQEVTSSAKKVTIYYTFKVGAGGVVVSGSVTSFNDTSGDITLQLIPEGLSEPAYETTVKGNTVAYSFADVVAGTYTLKVSKANHVTREYTVVVGNSSVLQDVKIHLLGDINGDGRVNVSDVGLANAHAKKVSTLEGYQFDCANVNGDTRITISDVGLLNAHAKKTSLLW